MVRVVYLTKVDFIIVVDVILVEALASVGFNATRRPLVGCVTLLN